MELVGPFDVVASPVGDGFSAGVRNPVRRHSVSTSSESVSSKDSPLHHHYGL
jgi:hypothetical protein